MCVDLQYEREEDAITQQYRDGEISLREYNASMEQLYREWRDMAEHAAQEAYDNEMRNWR